jgi:transcriptional regulator with PAS, ATPase and Fis domain
MTSIAQALAARGKRDRTAYVHRCHANLIIVAVPVLCADGIASIAYASGARVGADPATAIAAAIGCPPEEAAELAAATPLVAETDVARVGDLVAQAAAAVERALPIAAITPTTHAHPFSEIVGEAAAVREVIKLLTKVVRSEATVLVHGESGTGKELIARAIHYHGPRGKKPFVVQNCSAFNDNLLESALFGHVRGAFTGAVKDQKGLFEVADGGTFFLDEIGDMSAALQVKLLRVLQEGTLTPVGGTKPIKVDVRIIAASHKDLATMVSRKEFREDLFYRVNVLKITVPPLRDRVADIPRLADHFMRKHRRDGGGPAVRLTGGALSRLVAYAWPGNIRELENEIERMLVLAGDATELTASMVSPRVAGAIAAAGVGVGGIVRPLRDTIATAESNAIVQALGRHAGDRELAASELGVSRAYLDARAVSLGLGSTAAMATVGPGGPSGGPR